MNLDLNIIKYIIIGIIVNSNKKHRDEAFKEHAKYFPILVG